MSTPAVADQQALHLRGLDTPAARLAADPLGSRASEREEMLDRLRSLRRVLPVLAQEMACARRQAARLRVDNRQLTEQVRQLRTQLEARPRPSLR